MDHILSEELSTMACLSWLALHDIAHSFIELDEAMVHVISFIIFLWFGFNSVCLLMDKDKGVMEAPWWEKLVKLVIVKLIYKRNCPLRNLCAIYNKLESS